MSSYELKKLYEKMFYAYSVDSSFQGDILAPLYVLI